MERLGIRGERVSPEPAMAFELRSSCVTSIHPPPVPPLGCPTGQMPSGIWATPVCASEGFVGREEAIWPLQEGEAPGGHPSGRLSAPLPSEQLTFLGVSQHAQLLCTSSLRAMRPQTRWDKPRCRARLKAPLQVWLSGEFREAYWVRTHRLTSDVLATGSPTWLPAEGRADCSYESQDTEALTKLPFESMQKSNAWVCVCICLHTYV